MISLKRWRYTFLTYFLLFQSLCVQPCLVFWFGFHSILFCIQFKFWYHNITQTHFLFPFFMTFETGIHELISRLLGYLQIWNLWKNHRLVWDWKYSFSLSSTEWHLTSERTRYEDWYNPLTKFEEWIEREKKCIQEKSFRNILDALKGS